MIRLLMGLHATIEATPAASTEVGSLGKAPRVQVLLTPDSARLAPRHEDASPG
jgi:hypothetical protein